MCIRDRRDGSIRVTEQGEVLSTRYHDPDLAHRILEQMAYGVMLGIHAAGEEASAPQDWRDAMEEMSQAGFGAYKALVHDDPEFLVFWRQATPIDEISNLKLGSRPTYRKATRDVADLRAIPWVFSWMQSRFNFPGWFGLGSALDSMLRRGPSGRERLRAMHAGWPFFQTLIDNAQPVSYTHLDVYKRQIPGRAASRCPESRPPRKDMPPSLRRRCRAATRPRPPAGGSAAMTIPAGQIRGARGPGRAPAGAATGAPSTRAHRAGGRRTPPGTPRGTSRE